MKRKIALLLSLILMVTMLIPISVFAEGDKSLENAIKAVKEKFDIPKELTQFNYNIYTNGDRKEWNLDWNSKDGNSGSMSVRVDENGKILSYSYWKPYDYTRPRRLPKVSKQDAKAKAEAFIKKVDPNLLSQLVYNENNQYYMMDYTYNFNYTRTVKGIPFPANNVSISVNNETGEIQNYYCNWNDELVFPDAGKAITLEKAQEAYKEKLGLKLVYNYTNMDDKIKTYLAYVPKYTNSYIDALTGEKVDLLRDYYGPYYDRAMGGGDMYYSNSTKAQAAKEEVVLSPEELKAVDDVSKLLSQEDMEKTLRASSVLGLTKDFKLDSANLYRDWSNKDNFIWNFYFSKQPGANNEGYGSLSVSANAKTGEITNFWVNLPYKEGETAKYDMDTAKKAVEDLLKEIQPDKFAKTELDETGSDGYYRPLDATGKPREYSFRYLRKEGSATVPSNSLYVRYDAVNGKIASFEMNWINNLELAPADNILGADDIYSKLFSEIGLEMQYKMEYPDEYAIKYGKIPGIPGKDAIKPEIKLVYAPKPTKPVIFDANTGVVIGNDGQPFKEVKPVEYTDIAGNFAEKQIKILAELGVALPGTEFKPGENIKQKDFLYLLSKTSSNYYYGAYPALTAAVDKEIEQMYSNLIRDGIVKDAEKAPDSLITREDAVKFLIRSLKYDKVADIKGIFNCTFKDKDKISESLIGYVAIAQGLNIISGDNGNFNPKGNMTRAQAAVVIYNYMQN